tara:strand:+ start:603 stop:893 length:291 start_codon:yes stop_codon:yes gene_type:complete
MSWFLVVYFLVNGSWVEADLLEKEGWSPIHQENYEICIDKIKKANERFEKISEFKNVKLDIKFKCECRENQNNLDLIECKKSNWIKKFWDNLILFK